jgi:hypothetical protein
MVMFLLSWRTTAAQATRGRRVRRRAGSRVSEVDGALVIPAFRSAATGTWVTVKRIANAVVSHAVVLMALTGTGSAQTPVLIGFEDGEARLAVRRAVERAAARLADPRCQDVLSDFADESGQPLAAKLQASGRTPGQALKGLRFFDHGMAPQCQTGTVMAFTHPGSQVIRVCGRQFRDRDPEAAKIILIHEFLHALGLGENPPTSRDITKRVMARCGDRC